MSALPDTEALAKLLADATPGPWRELDESECVGHEDGNTISIAIGKRDNHAFALAMHPYSERIVDANAALIVLAPALAAQRIADAARIAELEAAHKAALDLAMKRDDQLITAIAQKAELEAALRHLANEAAGVTQAFGPEMRQAIGNTNFGCLTHRIEQAETLLTRP